MIGIDEVNLGWNPQEAVPNSTRVPVGFNHAATLFQPCQPQSYTGRCRKPGKQWWRGGLWSLCLLLVSHMFVSQSHHITHHMRPLCEMGCHPQTLWQRPCRQQRRWSNREELSTKAFPETGMTIARHSVTAAYPNAWTCQHSEPFMTLAAWNLGRGIRPVPTPLPIVATSNFTSAPLPFNSLTANAQWKDNYHSPTRRNEAQLSENSPEFVPSASLGRWSRWWMGRGDGEFGPPNEFTLSICVEIICDSFLRNDLGTLPLAEVETLKTHWVFTLVLLFDEQEREWTSTTIEPCFWGLPWMLAVTLRQPQLWYNACLRAIL